MMSNMYKGLSNPKIILRYILWKIINPYLLSMKSGVTVKKGCTVIGWPIIQLKCNSRLIIGENVTLNSRNIDYHVNMYSPVKMLADREEAVIIIGDNTRIHGTCIHAYSKIKIGDNCLIAANTQIFDGNGHDLSFPDVKNRINTIGDAKPILIEDNVWIGANSIILPGICIGFGSVIASGSVVTKDIPPLCVAGGNPAKIIKNYSSVQS